MAEQVIRDWLAEYKSLSSVELHSFATTQLQNEELLLAILSVFEDRLHYLELLEPVCIQLFGFYRSEEADLQHFVLQCIPTLIGVYLSSVGQLGDKLQFRHIEVLLLGIYNLEVVDSSGKPHVQSFRLPSLAQPSIYHEPMSTASSILTENALSRLDKGDTQSVTIGPFPQVESLNNRNRLRVLTILLNIYNSHLSYITKSSLSALCKTSSRLMKQGFSRPGHSKRSSYGSDGSLSSLPYQQRSTVHRIATNPPFLLEILHAVYFAIFNGLSQLAIQTLEDIHQRATYELFPEVLLVTNSIRNSLRLIPAGQSLDRPMGISVALSPTTSTTTISKAIITNASFRTKKLPDDIPIQDQGSESQLVSITEEEEATAAQEKQRASFKSKEKISMVSLLTKKVEKTVLRKESPTVTEKLTTEPFSLTPGTSSSKAKEKERYALENKKRSEADMNLGKQVSAKMSTHSTQNGEASDSMANPGRPPADSNKRLSGNFGGGGAKEHNSQILVNDTEYTAETDGDDTASLGTLSEMDDTSVTESLSSKRSELDGRVSSGVMHTMV